MERVDRGIEVGLSVMSIGDRLRSIRTDIGATQEIMAEIVGLGAASWKRLELEDRAPKGDVMARLVEMGYSADWLLTGFGQMRRDASVETTHRDSESPTVLDAGQFRVSWGLVWNVVAGIQQAFLERRPPSSPESFADAVIDLCRVYARRRMDGRAGPELDERGQPIDLAAEPDLRVILEGWK